MSILKMPELIESGKLILDNEKNYYSNNSSIKYAYIVSETKINGKNANIKITVRKSPQNNKFLVHHIYIEKGTERTSAGTSKSPKTAFIPFDASDSISQSPQNVNTKNDENSKNKKYAVDDTIQDEKYDNIESLEDENIMQEDFENKVDQIENNTYNSDDVVIMGRTPKVLQDIGFNSLPVAMTKKHIYSVAVSEARAKNEGRYNKNTNYHNLGFNAVKQIYNKISDPLMVIVAPDFTDKTSRYSTHRVIALVDLSVNNKQVIAPIAVDFEGIYNKKIIDVNLVATYFNKNNIHDLIKEAIALENNNQIGFYYLDKKRTQSIIKHAGFQLPSILNNSSSNIIIRKIDENINKI